MGIIRQPFLFPAVARSAVQHRPRHPEVNQQSPSRLEPNNQILATAIDECDPLALELPSDCDRVERARQAGIRELADERPDARPVLLEVVSSTGRASGRSSASSYAARTSRAASSAWASVRA